MLYVYLLNVDMLNAHALFCCDYWVKYWSYFYITDKCGIVKMAEHNETDSDCPGDGWLSSWEKKCLDEWEKESIFEERLQVENEKTSQKIWQSFQNSATAVSRLFKGKMTGSYGTNAVLHLTVFLRGQR